MDVGSSLLSLVALIWLHLNHLFQIGDRTELVQIAYVRTIQRFVLFVIWIPTKPNEILNLQWVLVPCLLRGWKEVCSLSQSTGCLSPYIYAQTPPCTIYVYPTSHPISPGVWNSQTAMYTSFIGDGIYYPLHSSYFDEEATCIIIWILHKTIWIFSKTFIKRY